MSWKGEKYRHSMASRGIKSSDDPIKKLQESYFKEKHGVPPGFAVQQIGGYIEITNLENGKVYECPNFAYNNVIDALWNLFYDKTTLTINDISNIWNNLSIEQKQNILDISLDIIQRGFDEIDKMYDLEPEYTSHEYIENKYITKTSSFEDIKNNWPYLAEEIQNVIQEQHDATLMVSKGQMINKKDHKEIDKFLTDLLNALA